MGVGEGLEGESECSPEAASFSDGGGSTRFLRPRPGFPAVPPWKRTFWLQLYEGPDAPSFQSIISFSRLERLD